MPTKKQKEQANCSSYNELVKLGTERGYENPEFWASKIWEARQKNKRNYNYKPKKGGF